LKKVRRNVTASGRRSKFEDRVAADLEASGIEYEYEAYSYEYDEPLRKNLASCGDCGSRNLLRTGWYTPDFFLESGVIIETKGRFTAADRRKMVAVKRDHPNIDIKMLFMKDNKIHKNSKTYYSDWCMENGYDFAIGEVPRSWLNPSQN
jgi:hypothetical protein